MMRCRKHFSDVSSTVGVCASCLRERLFAVIAAQAKAHAAPRSSDHDPAHLPDDPVGSHGSLDPPPTRTVMMFPRSVSPYVAPGRNRGSRFYHTPEAKKAEPMTGDSFSTWTGGGKHGWWRRKLSFLQNLQIFRSRSGRVELETGHNWVSPPGFDRESPESSPSFPSLLKGRRKNRPPRQGNQTCYADDDSFHRRSSSRVKVRETPDRGFPQFFDTESRGGYVSERGTPASSASTGRMRYQRGSSSDAVGMRFCLSPLVRASTVRRWRHPLEEGTSSFEARLPQAMAGKR
ncbi:hypothetical protein MLD38_019155 [Melastoma candidum]|uniref:Uncharacterized protein n=1 Tax=Melastoma candidum TaxID=119954 RepID=A0ACB9QW37_9MYRT|nr:hypothetical protein MLD38_019155 [Melastoma candidum]